MGRRMTKVDIMMNSNDITPAEFKQYQDYLLNNLGIKLGESKGALVRGRLHSRIRKLGIGSYGEYLEYATSSGNHEEYAIMIDKLTTHETHFFREMGHFKWLLESAPESKREGHPFRAWSAACSTGEEAYSIAMTLDASLGRAQWEVVGSDVSHFSVEKAIAGVYDKRREREIPENYLKSFCMRGIGSMDGYFAIKPELKQQMVFRQMNLMEPDNSRELFDVVFMNNVMIYFEKAARIKVLNMVSERMQRGGYLIVGASESLNGITEGFQWLRQSIYRKK